MSHDQSNLGLGFTRKSVLVGSIAIALLAGLLIFWLARTSGNFVIRTVDYVVAELVSRSGVSPFLVRGLVILVTIPFFWAVAKYAESWWGVRKLKPSLKLYTNRYGVIIVGYVGVFFIAMYFASRDAYAFKWCAETPEGIRAFDGPGVDPVYGTQLKPCSYDQRVTLRQQVKGFAGARQITVDDPRAYEFFDPASGRPKVWYSRSPDGDYELFDRPGTHPRTGQSLQPIKSAVVQDLIHQHEERLRQEQQDSVQQAVEEQERKRAAFVNRYINTAIVNRSGVQEVGVLVLDVQGEELQALQELSSQLLKQKGAQPILLLFKPPYIQERRAKALFDGDWSVAQELGLSSRVDKLLLGFTKVDYTTNRELGNLLTANLQVQFKCLELKTQTLCGSTSINTQGVAYSQPEAMANAISRTQPMLEALIRQAF